MHPLRHQVHRFNLSLTNTAHPSVVADPLATACPRTSIPSIEMLEIAWAMDEFAGAGGQDGRAQIKETGAITDRCRPD